jgi:calcineurin-like phosphoesterase family protein
MIGMESEPQFHTQKETIKTERTETTENQDEKILNPELEKLRPINPDDLEEMIGKGAVDCLRKNSLFGETVVIPMYPFVDEEVLEKEKLPEWNKIILAGDLHYSINSLSVEEKWFPDVEKKVRKVSPKLADKILNFFDQLSQKNAAKALKLMQEISHDADFFMGDMTAGSPFGIVGEKSEKEAEELKEKVEEALPGKPRFFVKGGHEEGNQTEEFRTSTEEAKLEGLEATKKLFGPLYYSVDSETHRFIIMDSQIAQTKRPEYQGLKKSQEDWLIETIKDSQENNKKMILLLHDYNALKTEEISNIINEVELQAIFAAHYHKFRPKAKIAGKEVTICPGVIGFLALGIKPGILEVHPIEDGAPEVKFHRLPKDKKLHNLINLKYRLDRKKGLVP